MKIIFYLLFLTALLSPPNIRSKNIQNLNTVSNIEKAHQAIQSNQYTGIDALLVYQKGKLLSENYYGDFSASKLHRTHSTFKSITSLITLIAVEQKLLSLDEPVLPLLAIFAKPINFEVQKKQITVKHLLNMNSGIACDESPGGEGPNHEFGVDEGKSPLRYSINIKMAVKPGTRWRYCNANSFLLAASVSAALKRANRENIFEFADKYLMKPLNISQYRLTRSYDGRFLNGQGNSYFLPKDLAKFGLLLLNQGKWNNNQIISHKIIEPIYQTQSSINWSFTDLIEGMPKTQTSYSFQWYKTVFTTMNKKVDVFHSWGNGGQFIFVIPELQATIVFTGSNQGNFIKQKQPFEILYQYLLPELMQNI